MLLGRDERRAAAFEQLDELRVHVFVVVRDVEDDDAFAGEGGAELPIQAVSMRRFHHHNEIRPLDLIGGERDDGIVVQSCGIDINVGTFGEDGFRSRTPQLVL